MRISNYAKFITAVVGLVVSLGILDQETAQEIGAAITAVLVYLIPNS